MKTVYVASSRTVGEFCRKWAHDHLPDGWSLAVDPYRCDVFVSVMYDTLLTEEFINRPGRRCYNFHPGLLPQYRGSGAFSWAILNGEKETGVTLHELDVNIDTGPIIERATFPIREFDTAHTLFESAMDLIRHLFAKWFVRLLDGNYEAVPQFEAAAKTYYRKRLTAQLDLTRYVRAFHFPGKPGAFYVDSRGKRVEVEW